MKKFSIVMIIILLCFAGWAGATYVVGGQVEAQYSQLLDEFGQMGPVSMSMQSYQRGFLASTTRTTLEITLPATSVTAETAAADSQTLQLVFESAIQHGPFPAGAAPGLARITTRLVSVTPGQEQFEQLLKELPQLGEPLSVTTISFSGDLTDHFRLPAIETNLEQELVKWGGMTVDTNYSPRAKTLVGSFSMPKLEFRGEDGEMSWQGLTGAFDLLEALPFLYVGSTNVDFGSMEMNFANQKTGEREAVQLKGLKVASQSNCTEKLVSLQQTLELGVILVDGATYGPGRCVIDAKNLDGEVLSSFQAQIRELYRNGQVDNPEALLGQLLPLYTQMLVQLLEKSPELNISSFNFATPQGNIDGRLLFRYDGSQGIDLQNPQGMLLALDASADLAVHENLVKLMIQQNLKNELFKARQEGQIPETFSDADITTLASRQTDAQLEMVLAQALVVRDGEMIRSNATFKQGELVVNGQNLPLFQ